LNEWSIGFYTELDFKNEARNQQKLRDMMLEKKVKGVMVPKVYNDLCTRRILVSEWVEGKKLSDASKEEINRVTPFAQEAFLTQLFEVGFFHADPHPGNLLLLNEPTEDGVELALIDCGLMAAINEVDRDYMISAVIHLANKDYASLVDDFIKLKILPDDTNRAAVIPLMDKALSPYVKGGGAKKYEEELKKLYNMEDGNMQSQVGGFQAMTQDALVVLNDIPFSIPPYFAILGRAIVTLEGVALTGNPEYGIILEAYPFIARKLLTRESSTVQKALQEVLYGTNDDGTTGLKLSRLLALLNNAAGSVVTQDGAVFVDIDAVPEDGISFQEGLKFMMSDEAESLRTLLEPEVDSIVDTLTRQIFRQGIQQAIVALTPPRPPAIPFLGDILPPSPKLDEIPLPLLLPGAEGVRSPSFAVTTIKKLTDVIAPKLSQDDELFALGLADAAQEFFGGGMGDFVRGESVFSAESVDILLSGLRSGVLGKTDLLSQETIQNVVDTLTSILNRVQGSSSSESSMEKDLRDAVNNLDATEKERFDGIINELTQRSITRLLDRLSNVERA
jgi:aarF domain-containing kinase